MVDRGSIEVACGASPLEASRARVAWILGGCLFLVSAIFALILQPLMTYVFGGNPLGDVVFALGILVFAFGIKGAGSVTARRPLGTLALVVLAAWTLLVGFFGNFIFSDDLPPETLLSLGYTDSLVRFLAAVIAAVQIGRVNVVPKPWGWAPSWAIAGVALISVIQQVLAQDAIQPVPPVSILVDTVQSLIGVGSVVFLGVLAIVLANQPQHRTA